MATLIIELDGWHGRVHVTANGIEHPARLQEGRDAVVADLPPGRYQVEVIPLEPHLGLISQRRTVDVGHTPRRLVFFAVLDPELSRGPGEPPEVLLRDGAWQPYQPVAGLVTLVPSAAARWDWPEALKFLLHFQRRAAPPFQPPRARAAFEDLAARLPAAGGAPSDMGRAVAVTLARALRLPDIDVDALGAQLGAGPPAQLHLAWNGSAELLAELRLSPMVATAGPTVEVLGQFTALLPSAIMRLRPEVGADFPARLAGLEQGPSAVEPLFAPGLYRLRYPPDAVADLPDRVWRILEQFPNEIETLDLETASAVDAFSTLRGLEWHLDRMRVPPQDVGGHLEAPCVIAVVDRNGSFRGLAGIGLGERLLAGIDEEGAQVHTEGQPRQMEHGASAAAVAAAPPGAGGVVGVAPRACVRPIEILTTADAHLAQVLFQAAGLGPSAAHPPADVFSCSVSLTVGLPTTGMVATLRHLTRRGRGGRGCVFFSAAGNGAGKVYQNNVGYLLEAVACGATSLEDGRECRSRYSNKGADLCAPSSAVLEADTPAECPVLHPSPPAMDGALERLLGADDDDAEHLTIAGTPDVAAGDYLALRLENAVHMAQVGGPPEPVAGGLRLLLHTAEAHALPAKAVRAPEAIELITGVRTFGGTSAATPLCAATAALMLQVAPDLTWVEVLDLMRETSVRDLWERVGQALQPAQWPDDGLHKEFGWGRIDATAALQAAAERQARIGERWLRFDAIRLLRGGQALDTDHLVRGEAHTVAVLLRSGGAESTPNTTLRVLVAGAGFAGTFPDAWDATQQPGPGTWDDAPRLVAEAEVGIIATERLVLVPWPAAFIPPAGAACKVLLELTPQLGPDITGVEPATNPNLATVSWPIADPLVV